MIYVITDSGVRVGKNLKEINNRNHILIEEPELISCGADKVVRVTNQDIDFLRDKARVSNIMFGNFFKKDNSAKILMIINIILTVLIIFTK